MADRDVEAFHARIFLIQNGIDSHRGLTRLAVANDQFALAATDGRHGVNRFEAGLQRFVDRLPFGDPWSHCLHRACFGGFHGALSVKRITQRIEHASNDRITDGYGEQATKTANLVTFANLEVVAENNNPRRCSLRG